MKNILIFLFSFLFIQIINIPEYKPVTNLIEKLLIYIKEGKMVLNSTHYFIFDELNIISEIPNITKIEVLNQKQKDIYSNNGISTYIFIVSQLEGHDQNLISIMDLLYVDIAFLYSSGMRNSIIALYLFNSKELKIGFAPSIEYKISNEYVEIIKTNFLKNFANGKYYDGLLKYFDDIDYYFEKKKQNKLSKKQIKTVLIYFLITFVIIIIISIGLCMFKRIFCGSFEPYENGNLIFN